MRRTGEDGTTAAAPPRPSRDVPRRSWAEVRWRQFRNAPRPIARAVGSSLAIGGLLGVAYLAYDVAIERGARFPGGDLRPLAAALLVALVLLGGSLVTYLVVPQPSGRDGRSRRSPWSAALGLLAGFPIAYLVLVVAGQVLKPLLT